RIGRKKHEGPRGCPSGHTRCRSRRGYDARCGVGQAKRPRLLRFVVVLFVFEVLFGFLVLTVFVVAVFVLTVFVVRIFVFAVFVVTVEVVGILVFTVFVFERAIGIGGSWVITEFSAIKSPAPAASFIVTFDGIRKCPGFG
ncbi:MAG: hypothetical protein ACPHCN_02475, partial [Mycobacterium sp.]